MLILLWGDIKEECKERALLALLALVFSGRFKSLPLINGNRGIPQDQERDTASVTTPGIFMVLT